MPICKICRKPVTSGVVVHSECYEERHMERSRVMKRLTIDLSESGIDDIGYFNPNDPYGMYDILDLARLSECDDGTCASILLEISNKLSAYENTVLTPSEIEQLRKENAELKARFEKAVELPCKVGDTLYTNFSMQGDYFKKKNRPYSCKVIFIGINSGECFANIEYINGRQYQFFFKDFGKTVFLTKEEAERALKESELNG